MTAIADWDVIEAMIKFGGSFVHALGTAYRAADASNQAKLKAAFPDYWTKYADIARRAEGPHATENTGQ
jgi:hypothetical protein